MIRQRLKKFPVNLIYIQIIYNFIIKYGISVLELPGGLIYVNDIITIITFIAATNMLKKEKEKIINGPVICIILMIMFSILGLIINKQPILQYLWGLRNTYRFFMFMISCSIILEKEDIKNIIKIFNWFMPLIVAIATYQYFGKHLFQDLIGGIFGEFYGSCSYVNMYLCIVIAHKILEYLNKKIKFSKLILWSISALYLSTITELKIFYLEYILIFVLSVFYSKKNVKVIVIAVIIMFLTMVSINLLKEIYGFEEFFSIDGILDYSAKSGYSREENVNRLTAIDVIQSRFLTTKTRKFLGIGLGNADTSQYDIVNSDFYKKYGESLAYIWFSHAIMFLENGYVGLILYLSFFILMYKYTNKIKRQKKENEMELNLVKIISVLSIIIFIYNSSLRIESAYIWFWIFSIPYVVKRRKKIEYKSKHNSTCIQ